MTDQTPLDIAHIAMDAAPEDATTRLRFFERLADSELFLLLQGEAVGDALIPEVLNVDDAKYVLVFDREERLADFVGGSAHHAVLSGRVVATMLAGQGIGLGLNLGVAPSSILIPADAMAWLCDMLDNTPDEVMARPASIEAPVGASQALLAAIDTKLATAAGLARAAYLVTVEYKGGERGMMLGIIDALRTTYPRNLQMGARWMVAPHIRLQNRCPLQAMLEDGEQGVVAVLSELDCAYAWELSGSKLN